MNSLVSSIILVLITSKFSDAAFTREPVDEFIYQGSTARLSLSCISDNPGVEYSWRKNNTALDTSDPEKYVIYGPTLDILKPDQNDVGRYQCVARSDDGIEISNYGELTYAYIDDFPSVVEVNTANMMPGTGISFPCTGADFYPVEEIRVGWLTGDSFRYLTPPSNNKFYISSKTAALYFSNVDASNVGSYTCEIHSRWTTSNGRNLQKTSNVEYRLAVTGQEVRHAPQFLLVPENTIATLGGNVILECFAGGHPVPSLSWTKDSGNLPSGHVITPAGQLLLKNVTQEAEGRYTCVAENGEGNPIQSSADLTLEYAPQWTNDGKPKSSVNVDLSKSTSLRCEVTAVPDAAFQWLKDGVKLSSGDNLAIMMHNGGSTLDLLDASDEDAGIYQCIAGNDRGYIFSSTKLNVLRKPPTFEESVPVKTPTYTGSNVTLTCVVSAAPPADITWMKENQTLSINGQKYSLVTGGSLVIHNVTMGDAGTYTCLAFNMLLEEGIRSKGALLVYAPTIITKQPQDMEILEGGSTVLTCEVMVDADLKVSWKWRHDNRIVKNGIHYYVSAATLTMYDVTSAQTGKYQCCAQDDVAQVCGEGMITVTARPDPPYDVMVSTSAVNSQEVTWKAANANGASITSYVLEGKNEYDGVWTSMVTSPATINDTKCDVIDLLPYNAYSYRIAALNKIGRSDFSDSSNERKTLSSKPFGEPTEVGGGGGEPGDLVVCWKPISKKYFGSENVDYRVTYRKDHPMVNGSGPVAESLWSEKMVMGGKQNTTTITVNVDEIHVPYKVRVQATNAAGDGPFSTETIVYTAELAPTIAPTGLKLSWTKAESAEMQWNEVVDENGFTKGYNVEVCGTYNDCEDPKNVMDLKTEDDKPRIIIEKLKAKTEYYVRAAAFNLGGMGPWSSDIGDSYKFTTAGPPPKTAPSNVKIRAHGKSVRVSWDPVPAGEPGNKVHSYWVQYWLANETVKDGAYKETAHDVTHVEFTVPLEADYYVWVRAVNRGGEGIPSAAEPISTRPGQGGHACAVRSSSFLLLFTAILWFLVCVMH